MGYHFCRDCSSYKDCTIEEVKEGRQKYIKFNCPKYPYLQAFYPSDFGKLKIECNYFTAEQTEMEL